jgi:hypothetical protein
VGNPRLLALEGFWRPDASYNTFFECSAGSCQKELPVNLTAGELQPGYACRHGHRGHLCAVCESHFAYQGVYCRPCKPGSTFAEWSDGAKGGLLFFGLTILIALVYIIFFLPLCPRVEAALERLWQPAAARMEAALVAIVPRRSRQQSSSGAAGGGSSRPVSPLSRAAGRVSRPASGLKQRRRSVSHVVAEGAPSPATARRRAHKPPSRMAALWDVCAEPARIIISFWQARGVACMSFALPPSCRCACARPALVYVPGTDARLPTRAQVVSSFNNTLAVPWPSIYTSMTQMLSVVSLQLLRLPTIACIQPEISFYVLFNGTTIAMCLFLLFCLATFHFGSKAAAVRDDPARRRKFRIRVLNATIWSIFLAYPQTAATTLLIFSCTPLEDGTSWMTADYRLQCWCARVLLAHVHDASSLHCAPR